MLDTINKELNDKREVDFRQLQTDFNHQRTQFDAERTKFAELEQRHTEHLAKLQKTITDLQSRARPSAPNSKADPTTTTLSPADFQAVHTPALHHCSPSLPKAYYLWSLPVMMLCGQIYMDEMKVMKNAFELKLALANEQMAIAKQQFAHKSRLLNEALEEERRVYMQNAAKMR